MVFILRSTSALNSSLRELEDSSLFSRSLPLAIQCWKPFHFRHQLSVSAREKVFYEIHFSLLFLMHKVGVRPLANSRVLMNPYTAQHINYLYLEKARLSS